MEKSTQQHKDIFTFLVHPRDISDIYRKYSFARYFPDWLVGFVFKLMKPIVLTKIKGLKNKDGDEIEGIIISVSATAQQMLKDRILAKKKILQAVKFAEKIGAKMIGLGALTASLTKGGTELIGQTDVGITTGRVYTTISVTRNVLAVIKRLEMDFDKIVIAVVGAAGGIGSACTKVLSKKGIRSFILVDLERKKDQVDNLIQEIKNIGCEMDSIDFKISSDMKDVRMADIVIAATNTPEAIIYSEDLKQGAVIINDAQPSDISPSIFKERKDVLIIEGGIINTPDIKYNFNFGLAQKNDTFSCLAEVMTLSMAGWKYNYAIGYLDMNLIEDIDKYIQNTNFNISKFQNSFEGIITEEKIEYIKEIIHSKK